MPKNDIFRLLKDNLRLAQNSYYYPLVQATIHFAIIVLCCAAYYSPYNLSRFGYLFAAVYEYYTGITEVILAEKINFNTIYLNYHLHLGFMLGSYTKYRIVSLVYLAFCILYYSKQLIAFLDNQFFPVEMNKIKEAHQEYVEHHEYAVIVTELLSPVELILYSMISKRHANYTLTAIEYLVAILPFKYYFNEKHKEIWGKISRYFAGPTFEHLKGIIHRIAVFIIMLDETKQKVD